MNRYKARGVGAYSHSCKPSYTPIPTNRDEDYYEELIGGFLPNSQQNKYYDRRERSGPNYHYIKRWLRKQVGRLWTDVWSEVAAAFDNRTDMGREVRNHILNRYSCVDTNCFVDEAGEIRTYQGYRGRDAGEIGVEQEYDGRIYVKNQVFSLADGFYVHPTTGVLCWRDGLDWDAKYSIIRGRKEEPERIIKLVDGSEYREETCGRKPRNRFKAWFHYTYSTVVERDFYAESVYTYRWVNGAQERIEHPVEWFQLHGCVQGVKNGELVWGKWHERTRTETKKRTADREDMKIIRKALEQNRYTYKPEDRWHRSKKWSTIVFK